MFHSFQNQITHWPRPESLNVWVFNDELSAAAEGGVEELRLDTAPHQLHICCSPSICNQLIVLYYERLLLPSLHAVWDQLACLSPLIKEATLLGLEKGMNLAPTATFHNLSETFPNHLIETFLFLSFLFVTLSTHLIETWWRIEMKHLSEAGSKLSASHAVD